MIALPWPTPTHIVHNAYFNFFSINSWVAVRTNLVPDIPRGCPSAIAPPFGLTLSSSSSIPRALKLAKPCAANA